MGLAHPPELDVDDVTDLRAPQPAEYDDLVEAVDELGAEVFA